MLKVYMYVEGLYVCCRYIHICHSTKAAKWCKIEIADRVVVGIVISSLVYNIPRFFEYYKIWEVSWGLYS